MEFKRYFTQDNIHPYNEVKWKEVTSQINDKDGNVIFKQEGVEFPDFWEQNAIDITVEKYFAASLPITRDKETSLIHLINRLVRWYSDKGERDKYFSSKEDLKVFRDELAYLLLHQYVAFNTPANLNVGIQEPPQVSACFILSAEDNMESISENMNIEMDIFKKGSGAGSNRSNLRSSRETVSTGGKAMGPTVASQIYDKIANATKSGGRSRRAAKMEILDIDHGDIVNFVTQKAEIERIAKVLIENGWSSDFDDPKGVYKLLGLQNFNESVSVTDVFMKAVEKDEDWALLERKSEDRNPGIFENKKTNQGHFIKDEESVWYLRKEVEDENNEDFEILYYYKVIEWVKARDLWALICKSAWECADPGLQFVDNINKMHTCKDDGDIVSSNPCSEYFFLDDTSCNLASLNLLKFLKEDGNFDIEGYTHAIRVLITAMDISVHNASYPTEKIKEKTIKYRTLGLGYTNVGALLLNKLLPYDSDEGRYYIASLTALLLSISYKTSSELASELGPFERYEVNKEHVKHVLLEHTIEIENLSSLCSSHCITKNWLDLELRAELGELINAAYSNLPDINKPIRNAQTVVIAPTGTISFMMGCETTGIEPVLGLTTYKKMVGGGFKELTTPSAEKARKKLGYHKEASLLKEHLPIFATSFGTENILSSEAHLKMLAAVQPFVSGGISKTINLPSNATIEDVDKIYTEAWKLGLKSVSIYRDNCKGSQPLNLKKDEEVELDKKDFSKAVRRKLPKSRPGHIHEFQISMQKGFLQFGFYPDTGELGEMFAEISKGGSTINGLMNTIAIQVSTMLQYGIPIEEIIDTFKELKFEPSGMTQNSDIKFAQSIPDYIGRYIEIFTNSQKNKQKDVIEVTLNKDKEKRDLVTDDTKSTLNKIFNFNKNLSGPPCYICGHIMVNGGNCYYCQNCGHSSGCS